MRCIRCSGRKKVYKINSGYSLINTGGVEVDCPLCLGEGTIKTLDKMLEGLTAEYEKMDGKEKCDVMAGKDSTDDKKNKDNDKKRKSKA